MKKSLLLLVIFLIAGFLSAQQLNFDTVIDRSARAVEDALPLGAMIAVLNFASSSETFSDHVIEELTGKLVMGRKVTIVDRRNMALISQEMNLQLSGDVSDESAQAIGKLLGAQSIVSGSLTNMGNFYRFRVRVINVETAAIQTQVSLDLRNDEQVAFLLGSSPTSVQPVVSGGTTSSVSINDVSTPLSVGTMVPGNSLTEKLAWLQRSADSHNTYIIEVNANETIAPHTFEFRGAINITVVLRGDNLNRIIRLRSNEAMFIIKSNVTFVLERNITIQGHNGNNRGLVIVDGGIFKMTSGSTITGNNNTNTNRNAGAVAVNSGTFEMTGGIISGNTGQNGGGVYVYGGTFNMIGGTISGNTARRDGGGVYIGNGAFNMRGGFISENTANRRGGGVSRNGGTFAKSGGTITGYGTDQSNGNVVKDEVGNIIARNGHAVFVNENLRKETTAGPGVNLSNRDSGRWD